MFRHIYEFCATIFVLQGVLLLPLPILAGFAWYRQSARIAAIEAALGRDRKQRDSTLATMLKALPKLQPLNCANCGSAVMLDGASAECISCHARSQPPADYAATLSLRRRLKRLAAIAVRHWYLARALTFAPARWFFFLMIFGEPAIFGICVVGAASYRDTALDRALEGMSEGWTLALGLAAFGGFIVWMVVFIMLYNLAREVRTKLPVFPVFVRGGAETTEFATCRACGGGIQYGSRAFAALCSYCGVENYRAEQTRRERAEAEGERVQTRASLFGAMEIIEDFTSTFAIAMTILVVGFLLLVLFSALRG